MELMNAWSAKRLHFLHANIPGLKDEEFIQGVLKHMQDRNIGALLKEAEIPLEKTLGFHIPRQANEILESQKADKFWELNTFPDWYKNTKESSFHPQLLQAVFGYAQN